MGEVTQILQAVEQGDPQAASQLLPLVYDELRRLAAHQMAHENPGQTLNATALVHEAYLRLVGDQQFANRRHFLAAAAESMRRILIENVRRKGRLKRGGGAVRQRVDVDLLAAETPDKDAGLRPRATQVGQALRAIAGRGETETPSSLPARFPSLGRHVAKRSAEPGGIASTR